MFYEKIFQPPNGFEKWRVGPSPFRERQGTGALKGSEEICSEGISLALFSPVSSFTSSRNTFLFPSFPLTHSGICTLEGRYSKRGSGPRSAERREPAGNAAARPERALGGQRGGAHTRQGSQDTLADARLRHWREPAGPMDHKLCDLLQENIHLAWSL